MSIIEIYLITKKPFIIIYLLQLISLNIKLVK